MICVFVMYITSTHMHYTVSSNYLKSLGTLAPPDLLEMHGERREWRNDTGRLLSSLLGFEDFSEDPLQYIEQG